jgi:hemoglobin
LNHVNEPEPPALSSLFDRVGGAETFDLLVSRFYEGIREDPVIFPMYPEEDIEGASWRLSTFLQQYFGGPTTYSDQRGHPRLRMRHQPFHINPDARDRWLAHMTRALDSLNLYPIEREELWAYFDRASLSMVNTFADQPESDSSSPKS